MTHPDFPAEEAYLQGVLEYLVNYLPNIEEQKGEIDADVSYGLQHYNDLNPDQLFSLILNLERQAALAQQMNQSLVALKKPYFARVDFSPDDGEKERHYIGKMSLLRDLSLLITDWRAPVSSLYYEGRIGEAGYDCPDGHITGDITLKRQIQIEDGKLEGFSDIDITTSDDFLQAALGASKDRRLKDIVTTIQAEQNRIIRAPLFKPLIVQGAAGSGKTTIALHRIAYLLYNHDKILKPKNVMILAPNRFFLSYISDVLPDLGVEQVTQTTFGEFVAAALELNPKKWSITPAMDAVAECVNGSQTKTARMEAARLKSTLHFKKTIENYAAHIEQQTLPREGFTVEGYEIFTQEAIAEMYQNTYTYLPTNKRAREIEKHLSNTLKREIPKILAHIEADYDRRRTQLKSEMPDGEARRAQIITMLDERDAILKEIRKKARTELKKYLKQFNLKPTMDYYQMLFTDAGLLTKLSAGLYTERACELIARESQSRHKKGTLEAEDLPPLLYLQARLFGLDELPEVKHVVIDEAQDCSLFQLAVMKEALKSDSFTIMGDLHQGILAHKGVTNWENVSAIFSGATALTLEQSYRTTVEIMDAANPVIEKLYADGTAPIVPLAVPVIRHGEAVEYRKISGAGDIDKTITKWQNEGCRSIAIIGKTAEECSALHKTLAAHPPVVTEVAEQYEGGVLIVPSYLVKGLEFDGVIIANAAKYTDEPLDVKLLYIAMTRALHRLLLYSA